MRTIFFRIFCILFALPCALLAVGSVVGGLSSGGKGGADHVLLVTHGALMALLATAFVGSLWRSAQRVAWWQTILVTVCCLVFTGIRFRISDPAFEVGFPLAVVVTGLLHPARSRLLRASRDIDGVLGVAALVSAAPVAVLAAHLASQTAGLSGDRQLDMVSGYHAAVSLPFLGLLAALRTPGWRLPAIGASTLAVVFGVASLLFPDDSGSAGLGGLLALVLGIGFVALAFRPGPRPAALGEPTLAMTDSER
jgi:hypothetical protein